VTRELLDSRGAPLLIHATNTRVGNSLGYAAAGQPSTNTIVVYGHMMFVTGARVISGATLVATGGLLVGTTSNVHMDVTTSNISHIGETSSFLVSDLGAATTASLDAAEASTGEKDFPLPFDETGFRDFLASLKRMWAEEDADGMEGLVEAFVAEMGAGGIVALAVAADRGELGVFHLVDVMGLLGRSTPDELRETSSWLMKRFLRHPVAAVRDSALIGLLLLEDKTALPALEQAAVNEPVSELRRELEQGIEYLRSL
jgi:hypothetical protein